MSSVTKIKEELEKEQRENALLIIKNQECKERCRALSGILDHLVVKNIMDKKDYNKLLKKEMLVALNKIGKDRQDFRRFSQGQDDATMQEIIRMKYYNLLYFLKRRT